MDEGERLTIRATGAADAGWVAAFMREHWGDELVVGHGTLYRPADLPGFAACAGEALLGLATYQIQGPACELVTLDSLREGVGVGGALVAAVAGAARAAGCARLWLITTNDNLHALGFYQRRGFALAALHRGAVDRARLLKPAIPLLAANRIPIRDELELELEL